MSMAATLRTSSDETISVPPTSTCSVASHEEKKTAHPASATRPTTATVSSQGRADRSRRTH